MIVTARPAFIAPTSSDTEWTAAIDAETKFDAQHSIRLAAGTARVFHPAVVEGRTIRRIVRRGAAFDLTVDHLSTDDSTGEPTPVHLRIAASTRAPVVSRLREPAPPLPLEDASNAVVSLPSSATAEDYFRALAAEELAAKTVWVKSLRHARADRIDIGAFSALLRSRVMRASLGPDVWLLLQAHGMIIRTLPLDEPTTPYSPYDEAVRQALINACAPGLQTICSILRRHPGAQSKADIRDDIFSTRTFLQQLLAQLIASEARNLFQRDGRVRLDALAGATLACLFAMGRWASVEKPWPVGPLAGETWGLGRILTAYSDAAKHHDDADATLEAAAGLTDMSDRLMATPEGDPDTARFQAEGLKYRATATCSVASVLSTAGDQASLERALTVVDETLGLLRRAPRALVERTNIAHVEAVAALQLGDVGRAREAVERGVAAAKRIKDDYQVKFFGWVERVANLIERRPAAVRSLPELQYELALASSGPDEALQGICAELQREMADDITSTTTIERLSTAFRNYGDVFFLSGDAVLGTAHPVQEGRQVASRERPVKRLG